MVWGGGKKNVLISIGTLGAGPKSGVLDFRLVNRDSNETAKCFAGGKFPTINAIKSRYSNALWGDRKGSQSATGRKK